ncbi:hypothetical protein HDU76_012610 [Blyttiomyces sp. JEL0837]|nr:hypothetical protein HDU76_012610 [Blyttiomyces sp. JEL0837]
MSAPSSASKRPAPHRFRTVDDIRLLQIVDTKSPWTTGNQATPVWHNIAELFSNQVGVPMDWRSVKGRFEELVDLCIEENLTSLENDGTEEENQEREKLARRIYEKCATFASILPDFPTVKSNSSLPGLVGNPQHAGSVGPTPSPQLALRHVPHPEAAAGDEMMVEPTVTRTSALEHERDEEPLYERLPKRRRSTVGGVLSFNSDIKGGRSVSASPAVANPSSIYQPVPVPPPGRGSTPKVQNAMQLPPASTPEEIAQKVQQQMELASQLQAAQSRKPPPNRPPPGRRSTAAGKPRQQPGPKKPPPPLPTTTAAASYVGTPMVAAPASHFASGVNVGINRGPLSRPRMDSGVMVNMNPAGPSRVATMVNRRPGISNLPTRAANAPGPRPTQTGMRPFAIPAPRPSVRPVGPVVNNGVMLNPQQQQQLLHQQQALQQQQVIQHAIQQQQQQQAIQQHQHQQQAIQQQQDAIQQQKFQQMQHQLQIKQMQLQQHLHQQQQQAMQPVTIIPSSNFQAAILAQTQAQTQFQIHPQSKAHAQNQAHANTSGIVSLMSPPLPSQSGSLAKAAEPELVDVRFQMNNALERPWVQTIYELIHRDAIVQKKMEAIHQRFLKIDERRRTVEEKRWKFENECGLRTADFLERVSESREKVKSLELNNPENSMAILKGIVLDEMRRAPSAVDAAVRYGDGMGSLSE